MNEERLATVPCPYCRGVILAGARRCKYCLAELSGMWSPDIRSSRNAVLAAFLSLLFPGLGQYYCGRSDKAIRFVFAFVILAGLFYWLTFPWVLVAAWAGLDAFREARKTR